MGKTRQAKKRDYFVLGVLAGKKKKTLVPTFGSYFLIIFYFPLLFISFFIFFLLALLFVLELFFCFMYII